MSDNTLLEDLLEDSQTSYLKKTARHYLMTLAYPTFLIIYIEY